MNDQLPANIETLLACEYALREAQRTSDVAALDRLVDDALVFTAPNGAVIGDSLVGYHGITTGVPKFVGAGSEVDSDG